LQEQIRKNINSCGYAMNDNFNTALTIGQLFNLLKRINSIYNGNLKSSELGKELFNEMILTFVTYIEDVLGLIEEKPGDFKYFLSPLLEVYKEAKFNREYEKVDRIRASLKDSGIVLKDLKSGIDWAYEE